MAKIFNFRVLIIIALVAISFEVLAKDFGKVGNSFEIKEEGFLSMVKRKLHNVDIEEHQQKILTQVKKRVLEPTSVSGLKDALKNNIYSYDPTYTLEEEVRLPGGEILYHAGTKVNPLDHMDFNRRMYFIDARKESQVSWLKDELKRNKTKNDDIEDRVILVGGKPLDLSEELGINIYFDQSGVLTKKFNLQVVPTIITHDKGEKVLTVREVCLKH